MEFFFLKILSQIHGKKRNKLIIMILNQQPIEKQNLAKLLTFSIQDQKVIFHKLEICLMITHLIAIHLVFQIHNFSHPSFHGGILGQKFQ